MNKLFTARNKFFDTLRTLVNIPMFINLVPFIQGEDAFLLYVYENKSLTPTELSKLLKITKGRVTALINSLSRKEYIEINTDLSDRRRILIKLSAVGEKHITEKMALTEEHFIELFKNLGEEDSILFVDLLDKVINKAKEL